MNYWHMNLHPTNEQGSDDDIRKRVLSHTIGMGIWNRGNVEDPQISDFKNRVHIGDIVVVLNGRTPIAVVKIIGDWYESHCDTNEIVWFPLRRAIKILGISNGSDNDCFANIRMIPKTQTGTLGISSDINCATYKYIHDLYECCKSKA